MYPYSYIYENAQRLKSDIPPMCVCVHMCAEDNVSALSGSLLLLLLMAHREREREMSLGGHISYYINMFLMCINKWNSHIDYGKWTKIIFCCALALSFRQVRAYENEYKKGMQTQYVLSGKRLIISSRRCCCCCCCCALSLSPLNIIIIFIFSPLKFIETKKEMKKGCSFYSPSPYRV